jgi:hypothetical protein
VNASPPSYLDKPENYLNRQGSSWILANYRTVSEALSALNEGKWSGGPGFIIIADSQEVAMIEFGLNGAYRVESTNSGVVYHTNHYLNPDLQKLNAPRMESSQRRFDFMKNYLESKKTFSPDDFIAVSKNPTIWLNPGGKVQTLSTWIVFYPEGGQPRLVIRMANPGSTVNEYTILIKDVFSGDYDVKQVR